MNDRLVLTDDLLRRALERRMAHSPAPQLLDRIVAGAAESTQVRAPRAWLGGRRRAGSGSLSNPRWWQAAPALAGVAAVALVAVLITFVVRPFPGPGGTTTPVPSASRTPGPTPLAVDVGDHAALRLNLGVGVDPIDVISADGSIWTANIHADDIRRFDPATMAEIARIPVPAGQGPAWFTATEGALWVTNQLGGGLDHIDTTTNTFTGIVGTGPTCGAPVQAFDSIWQSACDANVFLRIDPVTQGVETIPAENHTFLVSAGGRLITGTATGLDVLDPVTHAFEPLPVTFEGFWQLLASDGESIWVFAGADGGVLRIDSDTGERLLAFPSTAAGALSFSGDEALLTVQFVGIVRIDMTTNQVIETVPLNIANPMVAREAAGAIWVTDFDNSNLWRIEP